MTSPQPDPSHSQNQSQQLPSHAPDGTDLTLIRWMLSKTPQERLLWMQSHLQAVMRLRCAR